MRNFSVWYPSAFGPSKDRRSMEPKRCSALLMKSLASDCDLKVSVAVNSSYETANVVAIGQAARMHEATTVGRPLLTPTVHRNFACGRCPGVVAIRTMPTRDVGAWLSPAPDRWRICFGQA